MFAIEMAFNADVGERAHERTDERVMLHSGTVLLEADGASSDY